LFDKQYNKENNTNSAFLYLPTDMCQMLQNKSKTDMCQMLQNKSKNYYSNIIVNKTAEIVVGMLIFQTYVFVF